MGRAGELPPSSLMGWIALLTISATAFAALALLRVPRLLWSMAGAALMLGATGYALQGEPLRPARFAAPQRADLTPDEGLTDLRTEMFGRFGPDSAYLVAADALSRGGSPAYEVQALLGGIRRTPESVQLWTALGDAIARHDGGQLSPAARLAFDRARRLDARHPGPPFFLGLSYVRAGDLAAAEAAWRRALALTAPDAPYRPAIAGRLELLTRLRAVDDR